VGDLIHDEHTAALHQAVRDLPDHYRDVVILCDLEERNYDEVAGLLGCPIGTVRSRLHRARAMLGMKLAWLRGEAKPQGAYPQVQGPQVQGAYSG
jgi:RNA polymerase sigma-70 factor (ECF subfamily)